MRQIVGYGNHAGSYTSGALRFVEDLGAQQVQDIIDEFENALLPGLEADQYISNWVLHKDKGGTELHFLVAGEELSTGKRVNAYYHEKDRHRLYYWRRAMDSEHGFADPDDPARVRPIASHHELLSDKAETIERMENYLLSLVKAGVVNNRKEVKEFIKQIEGVEISRETKNQISIRIQGRKQPIPLKGSIYKSDFRSDKIVGNEIDKKSQEYWRAAPERARESRKRFKELYNKRAEYYQKRYGKSSSLENIYPHIGNNFSVHTRPAFRVSKHTGNAELHSLEETLKPSRPDSVPKDRDPRRTRSVQAEITPKIIKKEINNEREKSIRPRSYNFYERVFSRVQEARASSYLFIKRAFGTASRLAENARERTSELLTNGEKLRADGKQLQHHGEKIQSNVRRESGIKGELGKLEFNIARIRRHQVSFK